MSEKKPRLLSKISRDRRLRNEICAQRDRLYRLAWSWCRDPYLADDLVQEAQARALDKLDTLREETRLAVWLTRIMANLYRDQFRKTREETGMEIEPVEDEETPERTADRSQLVRRTRDAIGALKEDQRQIITLVDLSGFSYADTARILDVPVGTVMSRLSRARGKLREQLEQRNLGADKVVPLRKPS